MKYKFNPYDLEVIAKILLKIEAFPFTMSFASVEIPAHDVAEFEKKLKSSKKLSADPERIDG